MATGVLWLALIVAGLVILGRESYRPAPRALPERVFPATSAVALDPNRLSLLLFVHPQCPCTAATFDNLDRLRPEVRARLAVTILFVLPPGVPPDWEKGALWNEAHRLAGVRVLRDVDGVQARRFGVTTSGHVLVYSPGGRLLFSGGLTSARGQAGDNPGELAIIHLTKGSLPTDTVEKPVFGCTLL